MMHTLYKIFLSNTVSIVHCTVHTTTHITVVGFIRIRKIFLKVACHEIFYLSLFSPDKQVKICLYLVSFSPRYSKIKFESS